MFDIYAGDAILYSTEYQTPETMCYGVNMNLNIGSGSSLNLTMTRSHYLYDSIKKLRTPITVRKNADEVIFYGRVIDWTTDLNGRKNLRCECALTFLNDTLQPPRKIKAPASTLFGMFLNEHNMQVDGDKKFKMGRVSVSSAATVLDINHNGYTNSKDRFTTDFINNLGGILVVRYENDGRYLDWIENHENDSNQVIEYGKNIIELEDKVEAANLYTVLLPTGAPTVTEKGYPSWPLTIESVNNGSKLLENLEAIEKYGRIVGTHEFNDITDPAALKVAGEKMLEDMSHEPFRTLNVKAIDLKDLGYDIQSISLGAYMHILCPPMNIDQTLQCISIQYDLENLENTTYTFGSYDTGTVNQQGSLSSTTGISQAVGRATGGRGGGAVGKALKYVTEQENLLRLATKKIEVEADKLEVKAQELALEIQHRTQQGDELQTLITQNASSIELRAKKNELISLINVSAEAIKIKSKVIELDGPDGIIFNGKLVIKNEFNAAVARITKLEADTLDAILGDFKVLLKCNSFRCRGDANIWGGVYISGDLQVGGKLYKHNILSILKDAKINKSYKTIRTVGDNGTLESTAVLTNVTLSLEKEDRGVVGY